MNKKRFFVILTTLITSLIVSAALLQSVAFAVAGVREWRLTTSTDSVYDVDISGNRVMWTDLKGGLYHLIVRDNRTGSTKTVYSGTSAVMASMAGDKITWVQFRYGMGAADIYLYDLTTRTKKRLATEYAMSVPVISGDYVAWIQADPGGSLDFQVYLHRISTATTSKLTSDGPLKLELAIGGGKIVWFQFDLFGSGEMSLNAYDIAGSTESTLVVDPSFDWEPSLSTDGDVVAWTGNGVGNRDIYTYDFSSSAVRRLTTNGSDQYGPHVQGGRVVWTDERFQPTGGYDPRDIFMYDRATGVERRVTDNPTGQYSPQIFGNRIVWLDERYDLSGGMSADVFLADISNLDTKRPTTRMLTSAYSTTSSKTGRFKVSWAGTDPAPSEGGVATYDVQIKSGAGGTWSNMRRNTTDRYAYINGRPGHTYYFRARAKDRAGIQGLWSGVRSTVVPYDDRATTTKTGFTGLHTSAASLNFLGTLTYSNNTSDTIEFAFRGSRIALLAAKGPGHSEANIYIDGVFQAKIDTLASSLRARQIVFSKAFAGIATHRIRVENIGTPGRRRLDVDGFGVSN